MLQYCNPITIPRIYITHNFLNINDSILVYNFLNINDSILVDDNNVILLN